MVTELVRWLSASVSDPPSTLSADPAQVPDTLTWSRAPALKPSEIAGSLSFEAAIATVSPLTDSDPTSSNPTATVSPA